MSAQGRRLSKLEHRQREIDLQCPKCGLVAIMVPLEDGGTELRPHPEGEDFELAHRGGRAGLHRRPAWAAAGDR